MLDELDELGAPERHGQGWSVALVRDGIDALPDLYRVALLLCDVEGFGITAVAQWLDLEARDLRRELHRARQALRTLVARSLACAQAG